MARDALIPAAAVFTAVGLWAVAALRVGDPTIVEHTRASATGTPLDGPEWLDHAQAAQRIRPWQRGFRQARADLDAVDQAREAGNRPPGPATPAGGERLKYYK